MKIATIIAMLTAFALVATPLWTTGARAEDVAYTLGEDWTVTDGTAWSGSVIFTDESGIEVASFWIEIGLYAAPTSEEIHDEGGEPSLAAPSNNEIHGLKGFTYKVYKDRQDVGIPIIDWIILCEDGTEVLDADRSTEIHGAEGVQYIQKKKAGQDAASAEEGDTVMKLPGPPRFSNFRFFDENGAPVFKILVHSNSELLNKHMDNNTSFQIIVSIMQDSYPEGLGIKQFTFDDFHVDDREFQLDGQSYFMHTYRALPFYTVIVEFWPIQDVYTITGEEDGYDLLASIQNDEIHGVETWWGLCCAGLDASTLEFSVDDGNGICLGVVYGRLGAPTSNEIHQMNGFMYMVFASPQNEEIHGEDGGIIIFSKGFNSIIRAGNDTEPQLNSDAGDYSPSTDAEWNYCVYIGGEIVSFVGGDDQQPIVVGADNGMACYNMGWWGKCHSLYIDANGYIIMMDKNNEIHDENGNIVGYDMGWWGKCHSFDGEAPFMWIYDESKGFSSLIRGVDNGTEPARMGGKIALCNFNGEPYMVNWYTRDGEFHIDCYGNGEMEFNQSIIQNIRGIFTPDEEAKLVALGILE
jgi:hypothetical protein